MVSKEVPDSPEKRDTLRRLGYSFSAMFALPSMLNAAQDTQTQSPLELIADSPRVRVGHAMVSADFGGNPLDVEILQAYVRGRESREPTFKDGVMSFDVRKSRGETPLYSGSLYVGENTWDTGDYNIDASLTFLDKGTALQLAGKENITETKLHIAINLESGLPKAHYVHQTWMHKDHITYRRPDGTIESTPEIDGNIGQTMTSTKEGLIVQSFGAGVLASPHQLIPGASLPLIYTIIGETAFKDYLALRSKQPAR